MPLFMGGESGTPDAGISSIFVYLLAARLIPVINIWEQKELLLYKVHKPFHRTEVMVLGKPD